MASIARRIRSCSLAWVGCHLIPMTRLPTIDPIHPVWRPVVQRYGFDHRWWQFAFFGLNTFDARIVTTLQV